VVAADLVLPGKIRFHDLRHTYASIMIEQGENIKYIQTQLGHSSPTVTLNVYAHLMKPTNQDAVCRLEKTIFGNGDFLETSEKAEAKNA
jgi:integrase